MMSDPTGLKPLITASGDDSQYLKDNDAWWSGGLGNWTFNDRDTTYTSQTGNTRIVTTKVVTIGSRITTSVSVHRERRKGSQKYGVYGDWEREEKRKLSSSEVHLALDVAGFTPVGPLADVANAGLYVLEGNWSEAGWSVVAMVPIVGDAVAAKRKGEKFFDGLMSIVKCLTGKHSFVAGTKVALADGTAVPIEDVVVGDEVLATDPATGETAPRAVTATIFTEGDKAYVDLTVEADGESSALTATDHHPFWSESEGEWLDAGDLKPGMTLRKADGTSVSVVTVRTYDATQDTYNLTVADLHTYYVLAGQTPVLVHNSNCPTSAANGEKHRRQLAEEAGKLPGIRSADDIFDTPSVLRGGVTPDQVKPFFAGKSGWREEGLGRGKNAGGGWVIREYTSRGDPTGRMLRWNPGGGHHGEGAYWRVVGPEGDLGGIIR
ncbi:polymorphic toxin-type HINT domain-containing protein [Streptomyces sanyensis]|uniref:polymorphic toxin-type HINT domain-containing protein n=1 Tax=Streptomyces sanyensis TaxID=568869 RepID=UPI003D780AEA